MEAINKLLHVDSQVLLASLGPFIDQSAALFVDKSVAVRALLLKLYTQTLPCVPPDVIRPFFSVISSNLCCAMTHIFEDIRMDSLKFLDLCLDCYPGLVAENSGPLFLKVIGQLGGDKTKLGSGCATASVLNPVSRLASSKGKTQILSRQQRLLEAMIAAKTKIYDTSVPHDLVYEWSNSKGHAALLACRPLGDQLYH